MKIGLYHISLTIKLGDRLKSKEQRVCTINAIYNTQVSINIFCLFQSLFVCRSKLITSSIQTWFQPREIKTGKS